MASIRQRSNGWSVLWREDGRQRSRMFTTKAAAQSYAHQVAAGTADTKAPAGSTSTALTLRAYVLHNWLPNCKLTESTKADMRSSLNQLDAISSRPIGWIATHPAEVEDAIAESSRKDHGSLYMVVKRACDHAVRKGVIESHKLADLEVKRSYSRREFIPTTGVQRKAIAEGLGDRALALWLLHGCGMRVGEVTGLRGSDFKDGFRSVQLQRTAYLGRDTGRLKARQSGQGRTVPVPTWLAAMVREHVSRTGLGALFPGASGKEFCSYKCIGQKIGELAKAEGLPGFSPHQFRHAYVTNALDAGVLPAHLSEYTGDGINVLMDVYKHVTGRAFGVDRDIIDAIGM